VMFHCGSSNYSFTLSHPKYSQPVDRVASLEFEKNPVSLKNTSNKVNYQCKCLILKYMYIVAFMDWYQTCLSTRTTKFCLYLEDITLLCEGTVTFIAPIDSILIVVES
jgi:hypothetical protein